VLAFDHSDFQTLSSGLLYPPSHKELQDAVFWHLAIHLAALPSEHQHMKKISIQIGIGRTSGSLFWQG
jgi:hypothetical protein